MTERVEYTKRTAILGKTHVEQSFFAQKRADGTLCSARYPDLPTPFPYSKQSRNCDASSNFIDCNPQKKGVTLPPQRDHVRTEGFLYWL